MLRFLGHRVSRSCTNLFILCEKLELLILGRCQMLMFSLHLAATAFASLIDGRVIECPLVKPLATAPRFFLSIYWLQRVNTQLATPLANDSCSQMALDQSQLTQVRHTRSNSLATPSRALHFKTFHSQKDSRLKIVISKNFVEF